MIRAPMGDQGYWDEWVSYTEGHFATVHADLQKPSGDPTYRPQYVFLLATRYLEQILRRYSRGDPVNDLTAYFGPMLDAFEESTRLDLEFHSAHEVEQRREWSLNLDHYILSFWLVGLALALEIPDGEWRRLLAFVGNEGKDELLDRVVASREAGREIGDKLCHPKPYKRLLAATEAPPGRQAEMLLTFVDKWYAELDRPAKKGIPAMYAVPWWHGYPLTGAYFGFWCVEAMAAVKAFALDDSLCLGHPHYPGDLLRPNGPTMHRAPVESASPDTSSDIPTQPQASTGWLSRLLGRG